MYTQATKRYLAGVFVAIILSLTSLPYLASAKVISDSQVEEQKREVLIGVVELLRQDVKLLQMLLIQKLEARVEYLQSITDNQK